MCILTEVASSDNRLSLDGFLRTIELQPPLTTATVLRDLGVSTIPVKTNGSKEPAFSGWREYAERLPTLAELRRWYACRNSYGIGVTGGLASGHLAIFDFETWEAFMGWCAGLSSAQRAYLARCPVVRTPKGGAHIYVRLVESVKGCKLARTPDGTTLIEIRGCQHFVVAPGSPPSCHPTGRPYLLLRAGWFDGEGYDRMPLDVWHSLVLLAVELNEYRKPEPREIIGDRHAQASGDRPGDHFVARVNWRDVLGPHGWRVCCSTVGVTYWTRPGKPSGVSASTGFCTGSSGHDLLYVFSTSAAPFEADRCYNRFAAYAILNHRGDFFAATRALAMAGYGRPSLPRRFGKAVR